MYHNHLLIVLFGIFRSADICVPTINQKVVACARKHYKSVRILVCTNLPSSIDNPRSKEISIKYDPAAQFSIDADYYVTIRQQESSIEAFLKHAMTQRDPFGDKWKSIKNILFQLYSLKQAWRFIESNIDYINPIDTMLFARADLLFLDEFDFQDVCGEMPVIVTPSWQQHNGRNDRFALADIRGGKIYANRLDLIEQYCRHHVLHPESFLDFTLQKSGAELRNMSTRAARVRGDGRVVSERFD